MDALDAIKKTKMKGQDMKNLLKKISEINAKHWKMKYEYNPEKYKKQYKAYMAEMETAIHKYTKSDCDCTVDAGAITEYVCLHCGRCQK